MIAQHELDMHVLADRFLNLELACFQKIKVQYAEVIDKTASAIQSVITDECQQSLGFSARQTQDLIDANVKKLGELLKKSKVRVI